MIKRNVQQIVGINLNKKKLENTLEIIINYFALENWKKKLLQMN
jgi:hypothetical protein